MFTDHVEKKDEFEENIQTGIESDKTENDCIILDIEDPCDKKQIQEGEGTQQEQLNDEKHSIAVNPDTIIGFEGFERLAATRNSLRITVASKPSTDNFEDDECLGTAAETSAESSKTKAKLNRNASSITHSCEVQKSSKSISNAEEHPSEDRSRKRRAAVRVSSFKEIGLNR